MSKMEQCQNGTNKKKNNRTKAARGKARLHLTSFKKKK
jgi:hypothetical protein